MKNFILYNMAIDKEFKEALSNLPEKEKDKLILRLIKKDPALMRKLHFELVSEDSSEDRRAEMEDWIIDRVTYETKSFYSPGYLMMGMRDISGRISEHVKTTKDKYGEVRLNLLMLNEVLRNNIVNIQEAPPRKVHKLCVYVIARAYKILTLIKGLHEDYQIEFHELLEELGKLIGSSHYLMDAAIHNGFDVNWLITGEFPDDIGQIQKDLRAQGFLK
ncbi:hypothetical protein [Persicobacter diffluens]|uniref:Uncharacterized protein n=1 Tax=Persicobacter diffluens TaxID=981 RepID=A0AAN5AL37_9BACT|nr:hypothetical protein PEDI_33960 [Persicobacter diffluens]